MSTIVHDRTAYGSPIPPRVESAARLGALVLEALLLHAELGLAVPGEDVRLPEHAREARLVRLVLALALDLLAHGSYTP